MCAGQILHITDGIAESKHSIALHDLKNNTFYHVDSLSFKLASFYVPIRDCMMLPTLLNNNHS